MASTSTTDSAATDKARFPARTLSSCIEIVKRIAEHNGTLTAMSVKQIAILLDKAEITLAYPLAASELYGLLGRRGSDYVATDLFERIDTNPDDKNIQLAALKNPILYSKLIDELNGKTLPSKDNLAKHLIGEYKVRPNSAPTIVDVFLKNAEFLGIIENKKLRYLPQAPTKNKEIERKETVNGQEKQKDKNENNDENDSNETGFVTIPIPDKITKKTARIIIPEGYDDALLDRISKVVLAYKVNDKGAEAPL